MTSELRDSVLLVKEHVQTGSSIDEPSVIIVP
jgi:hypothetical protein